ncbi:MAG: Holliday junction resolvase RuvX [Bacteroidaceae bacterium]|nr:Holliday junction resolvase RuvX [Bacteroidaceae bacterium]
MARILAVDYGKRRTGLAVTDELQIIAGGLTTVDTKDVLDFILDYVKREQVECIVVGLPKQMNNQPSENMGRIRPFVNRLRKLINIPVEYYDERFTSVLAHQAILESGIGKMARRNKELVDEISATIILQSYMESRRMRLQNKIL